MSKAQLVNEVYALSTVRIVSFDIEDRWVEVKDVPTPDGWSPDTIDIRFELPEEYPEHQPHVYVPEELRFRDQRPQLMAPAALDEARDWCPLSINTAAWSPNHTLRSALAMVLAALEPQEPEMSETADDAPRESGATPDDVANDHVDSGSEYSPDNDDEDGWDNTGTGDPS